jgi:transposase
MLGELYPACLYKYVRQSFYENDHWPIRHLFTAFCKCFYMRSCQFVIAFTSGVMYIISKTVMIEPPKKNRTATGSRQRTRRRQALRAQGAAHPHPEAVTDPLFRDSAFFDPNDLVQVKYEMLRSVRQEGRSVVEAASASGLSRPVFYVTQELFEREGLPGLLPRKRGPKRPHKLNDESLAVLAQAVQKAGRMLKGDELAELLAQRFGVEAHPRSILRRLLPYLRRQEKKLQ